MSSFELFSLSRKNVLVTGSTGHLGESMAWGLAEAGANVLVNSRSAERCAVLVNAIQKAGLRAENATFDVTDEKAIKIFFESRPGLALHCLINNAYAGGAGTIETSDADAYHNSYEMSVVSSHKILRNALANLRRAVKETGDASVINIASMYGLVSPDLKIYDNQHSANPPFYGAAKAALVQWTKYAACEFGPEGIRVNSVSPGPFPSMRVQQHNPDFVAQLAQKVPMRRVGQPDEIKGVVVMLASAAASFVNGTNISVDGGWTSW